MIKLFASDIDGTLLRSQHQYQVDGGISDEDMAAISSLEAAGIQMAIATGRHYGFLSAFDRHRGLLWPTVSFNGGHVRTPAETIYENPYTTEELRMILRDFPEIAEGFVGITVDDVRLYYSLEQCREMFFLFHEKGFPWKEKMFPISLSEYLETPGLPPLTHIFFSLRPPLDMWHYEKTINARYANMGLQVVATTPHAIDFLKGGDNKAEGLKKLADHLGIAMNEVAVVGDSYNDIEMFEAAGRSFCIQDSPEEVACHADEVVPSVAEAIRRIL